MDLSNLQCAGCHKAALMEDRTTDVVCTACGLVNRWEEVPTVDDLTECFGSMETETGNRAAEMKMFEEMFRQWQASQLDPEHLSDFLQKMNIRK